MSEKDKYSFLYSSERFMSYIHEIKTLVETKPDKFRLAQVDITPLFIFFDYVYQQFYLTHQFTSSTIGPSINLWRLKCYNVVKAIVLNMYQDIYRKLRVIPDRITTTKLYESTNQSFPKFLVDVVIHFFNSQISSKGDVLVPSMQYLWTPYPYNPYSLVINGQTLGEPLETPLQYGVQVFSSLNNAFSILMGTLPVILNWKIPQSPGIRHYFNFVLDTNNTIHYLYKVSLSSRSTEESSDLFTYVAFDQNSYNAGNHRYTFLDGVVSAFRNNTNYYTNNHAYRFDGDSRPLGNQANDMRLIYNNNLVCDDGEGNNIGQNVVGQTKDINKYIMNWHCMLFRHVPTRIGTVANACRPFFLVPLTPFSNINNAINGANNDDAYFKPEKLVEIFGMPMNTMALAMRLARMVGKHNFYPCLIFETPMNDKKYQKYYIHNFGINSTEFMVMKLLTPYWYVFNQDFIHMPLSQNFLNPVRSDPFFATFCQNFDNGINIFPDNRYFQYFLKDYSNDIYCNYQDEMRQFFLQLPLDREKWSFPFAALIEPPIKPQLTEQKYQNVNFKQESQDISFVESQRLIQRDSKIQNNGIRGRGIPRGGNRGRGRGQSRNQRGFGRGKGRGKSNYQ